MPDTLDAQAPGSIDAHPDFPAFLRQAQEDVFREFAPRLQSMYASGNEAGAERLMAELDRQARSRAVVATRAMLNFHAGQGGPGLDRPFTPPSTDTPTLSGAESAPQGAPTTPPAPTPGVLSPPRQALSGAPVTSAPQPRSGLDLATRFTPAPGAPPLPVRPTLDELSAPPSEYDRPGYRPTSGIAMGPQSRQEEADLEDTYLRSSPFLEMFGFAPWARAGTYMAHGRPFSAAGSLAVGAIPYSPLRALGALGATYVGALGADIAPSITGMFSTPSATAQQGAETSVMSEQLAADRAMLQRLIDQQSTLRAQAEAARLRMEAERASGIGPRFNAAKAEYDTANARATAMDRQVETLTARLSPESIQRMQEYAGSVKRAEDALAEARAMRPRPFRETNVGQLYEATGGWTPAVVGAGTSGLARLLGRGLRESVAEGVLAGGLTPNAPLVWDMFSQPPYNPERSMYQAYARDLPPDHPRREEWTRYAQGLPEENPVRRMASEEFYNPSKAMERGFVGALEGTAGGLFGAGLGEGARMIGSSVRSGLERAFGRSGRIEGQGASGTATATAEDVAGTTRPVVPPPPPLPSLEYRRMTPNPEPGSGGHWVPPTAPTPPPGAGPDWAAPNARQIWVSPTGQNVVFSTTDSQGRVLWWRRQRDGAAERIDGPPPSYRRVSQAGSGSAVG